MTAKKNSERVAELNDSFGSKVGFLYIVLARYHKRSYKPYIT